MPFQSFQPLPVPRNVLDEMESALSNMKCKPSNLPEKLETIEICDGKYRIYYDGNLCILVEVPVLDKDGNVILEGSIHGFFYTHSFSMFSRTFNKASDTMPILIGDGFYYMPCGEALFHMMKAALFKDWDAFQKIFYAATPKECKAAGNKVQNFQQDLWDQNSAIYMNEIARLKLQCPDVYTIFKLIAETADALSIPLGNVFFYESTTKEKRYGTGLGINEMVQRVMATCVFKRGDELKMTMVKQNGLQATQTMIEPLHLIVSPTPQAEPNLEMKLGGLCYPKTKLGGLCYPGENQLGLAITKSFQYFVKLDGPKRTIDELMAAHKLEFGESFYQTILTVEEVFDSKKKLKLDDDAPMDAPMECDEGLAAFAFSEDKVLPVDARSLSETTMDVRTLSEGVMLPVGRTLSDSFSGKD